MFLPRKLQKRTHAGRTAQTSPTTTAVKATKEDRQASASNAASSAQHIAHVASTSSSVQIDDAQSITSSSIGTSTTDHAASAGATRTSAEAAKLERLIEFLFLRLAPISLTLGTFEERQRSGMSSCSDLLANITSTVIPLQGGASSKGKQEEQKQGPTIHLARLLNLVPGLATRCKSISLLSEALQAMQDGPAVGWFTLHPDKFQLEWSPAYANIALDLGLAVTSNLQQASVAEVLAPRLVYIESIPPRIRTRSQAAAYLVKLILDPKQTQTNRSAAVLSVFEPSFVDRHLMADKLAISSASLLEERWISGRGFFLLDSAKYVELLCRSYQWDLSSRISAKEASEARREPIRCLSWAGWIQMKELYLQEQQRALQTSETQYGPLTSQSLEKVRDEAQKNKAALDDGDAQGSKRKRTPTLVDTSTTTPSSDHEWYQGTILLLHLPPPSAPDSNPTLTIPHFTSATDLTPAFLNRHLKPQLEKQVPESISYIHTLPSTQNSKVAIRTPHPILATRLLKHFPQLQKMDSGQEQRYWTELPVRVRTLAQKRNDKLSTQLQT